MLVSGNIPVTNYPEMSSQKLSTLGSRAINGYSSVIQEKKRQKARIKYKKIKSSDLLLAPDGLPDEYYAPEKEEGFAILKGVKQYLRIIPESKREGNFFVSGVGGEEEKSKYFSDVYLLQDIESPTPREGAGTEAIQGLVEKSMLDESTNGRVILYIRPISLEDTSVQFFYKLGFRSADEAWNKKIEETIRDNLVKIEISSCYMYLPKGNIPKVLRYGQLF